MHRKHCNPLMTCLFGAALLVAGTVFGQLNEGQTTRYARIRKQFVVATTILPGEGKRPRKPHRRLYKELQKFLESLEPDNNPYHAATFYYQARLFLHMKMDKEAREKFDACLELISKLEKPDDDLPVDIPAVTTIQMYRALTFADQGHEAFVAEFEKIPEDAEILRYFDIGDRLYDRAAELAHDRKYDEAIRVYKIIKRFDLWEDEWQDPQKKINLLEYVKKHR